MGRLRRRALTVAGLVGGCMLLLLVSAPAALADNCSTPADCASAGGAASIAQIAVSLAVLAALIAALQAALSVTSGATSGGGQPAPPPQPGSGPPNIAGNPRPGSGAAQPAPRPSQAQPAPIAKAQPAPTAKAQPAPIAKAQPAAAAPAPGAIKATPVRNAADRFEIKHTGPNSYLVRGGGEQVWADGIRDSGETLLEAKYIGAPGRSPYVPPHTGIPDHVLDSIHQKLNYEFGRYAAVVSDSANPAQRVEVIVSDEGAISFFEELLRRYGIPGHVVIASP